MAFYGRKTEPAPAKNQKIYVDSSQITIGSEGIFVQFGDEWLATDAIYHDSLGCFISGNTNGKYFTWICSEIAIQKILCKL